MLLTAYLAIYAALTTKLTLMLEPTSIVSGTANRYRMQVTDPT